MSIKKTCPYCQKDFEYNLKVRGGLNRRFCSASCQRKANQPKVTKVICPKCRSERLVRVRATKTSQYTGLCLRCWLMEARGRRQIIPLAERTIAKTKRGYLEVCLPKNHPYRPTSRPNGSIGLHRLVMAEYLGRQLENNEVVHHINGIKDDNRIKNLELVQNANHRMGDKKSYLAGYNDGLKEGLAVRDKSLEKQIKLLQWQIKQLTATLQLKLGIEG